MREPALIDPIFVEEVAVTLEHVTDANELYQIYGVTYYKGRENK